MVYYLNLSHMKSVVCVFLGPEHPWLVRAYAESAIYPYGSIMGQELFQSGIIPSDTDFRIFRDFGKLPG